MAHGIQSGLRFLSLVVGGVGLLVTALLAWGSAARHWLGPLVVSCEIEFVVSEEQVGKGHGGKNEDDEYFDLNANI